MLFLTFVLPVHAVSSEQVQASGLWGGSASAMSASNFRSLYAEVRNQILPAIAFKERQILT